MHGSGVLMPKSRIRHCVFFDESGNAGANLLDPAPFFVICGISVRRSRVRHLAKELARIKVTHRFRADLELKGTALLASKNWPVVYDAAEVLLGERLLVFTVVTERRFMAASLIVEDFLDPAFNPRLDNSWTWPLPIKRELADYFYASLSPEAISLAATAFTRGGRDVVGQLYDRLLAEVDETVRVQGSPVRHLLQGAEKELDSVAAVCTQAYADFPGEMGWKPGSTVSPNYPAFADLLNRIEFCFSANPDDSVELVADKSRQFDALFLDTYSRFRRAPRKTMNLGRGIPLFWGLPRIGSFRSADSTEEPLLQYADYFAAGIRSILELSQSPNAPSKLNKAQVFFVGFLYQVMQSDALTNIVASDDAFRSFARFVATLDPSTGLMSPLPAAE